MTVSTITIRRYCVLVAFSLVPIKKADTKNDRRHGTHIRNALTIKTRIRISTRRAQIERYQWKQPIDEETAGVPDVERCRQELV